MDIDKIIKEGKKTEVLFKSLRNLNHYLGDTSTFLEELIRAKRLAAEANALALVKLNADGSAGLITASPAIKNGETPGWLTKALEKSADVLESNNIHCFYQGDLTSGYKSYLIFFPLKEENKSFGTEVYNIHVKAKKELDYRIEVIQALSQYYSFYETRMREKEFKKKTERLHKAFEVMLKLNSSDSFLESSMSICNELASRWSCNRVSFGLFNKRSVKIKALSNSEKFNRKMSIIRDLETVMEECSDQNLEINFPQKGEGTFVCRQAQKYSKKYADVALLSIPLRHNQTVIGIITFEREEARPFSDDEIELFRLIGDLFTPRLDSLKKQDRWFGLKICDAIKKIASFIIGAKYTWIKLIFIFIIGVVIWLSQQQMIYRLEASFTFDVIKSRVISAPFAGKITEILVENGTQVKEGDKLFYLDTKELELKANNLKAKKAQLEKKVTIALREGKPAEEQMGKAEIKGVNAELELINYSLNNSILKATIDGSIVGTDLHKKQFSVVSLGENILEIHDTNKIQPILFVPEEQVADVIIGGTGELAAAGYPDRKIQFKVLSIEKVARVIEQKNVYLVKTEIIKDEKIDLSWIRAGMEGVAQINSDERLMVWIYTRKAINWLRMYFWF